MTPPYHAVMPWGSNWAVVVLRREGPRVVVEPQARAWATSRDEAEALAEWWNADLRRVLEVQPCGT